MNKWQTITVDDLIKRNEASLQTGPFGTQLKASDYVSEGIPLINVRNIGLRKMRNEKLEFLDEKMSEKLSAHRLQIGDIVFGRKGAVDRHTLIDAQTDGWIQGSDCLRLRVDSKILCHTYLSYYLSTSTHRDWMDAVCSFAATMSSLNQDIVKRICFPLPPRHIQNQIADILLSYDRLIENNQRRITILEQMVEQFYREWFVRMRFPGHEHTKFEKGLPQTWHREKASKYFNYIKGTSYGSDEVSDDPTSMPFITLKSFNRGGGYRKDGLKYYSGSCRDEQLAFSGDVVMAVTDMTQNREVVGRVARVPKLSDTGAVVSLDVIKLIPLTLSTTFLYTYLRYSGFAECLKEFANGANVLHLSPEVVTQHRIIMPPKDLRDRFDIVVEPFYTEIEALDAATDRLVETSNKLIPRLLSGALSIDDCKIQSPPDQQEFNTDYRKSLAYA